MARTIWRSSSLIIFPELTDKCLLLWIMDKYEGYVIKFIYAQSYHDLHLACFRIVRLINSTICAEIYVALKEKHLFYNLWWLKELTDYKS